MKSPKLSSYQLKELTGFISQNNHSSKEIKRAQAIILLDKDQDVNSIKAITGLQRARIFGLRKEYLATGISSIEEKNKKIPNELLTKNQRKEISATLHSKKPSDLGVYFSHYDHWTTGCLADWIKRKFDVVYKSKTSLYVIFKQSKFTFHKPGRVYQKRDEQEVALWRREAGMKVKKALSQKNTIILAADEMSLSATTTIQKIWLPQGEYPKIECSGSKESRSMYGFLNIKNGKEHAFKTEWQNMFITYDVLGKLRAIYPNQKILLIWDKAPWHKGSRAQQFIKEDGHIETIDFPRAAPEENPQEHVWKKGRAMVTHNATINNIDQVADDFANYLNTNIFTYSLLGIT